jgi:hypothetical protein
MAIFLEQAERRWTGRGNLCRLLLCLMLLCVSGCGGCRKTPDAEEVEKQQAEEKAKKKEKEKAPFEAKNPAAVMPSGKDFAGQCKPGHWISQVWPEVKANRGDFQGELHTEITNLSDSKVPLVGVPYVLTNERPVALAKEQPKSLESCIWIPPRQDARSVNLRLVAGSGGPTVLPDSLTLHRMPSYQYFFIVLSQKAGRYGYLDKSLDSIHLHPSSINADKGPKYYEVIALSATRRPSLPTNALCWTSIAYLLWDDFDPALWDVDQQRALIDWLHWGGQIIISGPEALEQLSSSFLRPYLPASVEKSRSFSAADLDELSYWAGQFGRPPKPLKPWPGAQLKKDPHADYLPETGDLVIERKVGRGRMVVSAFRLTGSELTGWDPGFDCFFNACLLRRPAREFFSKRGSEELSFRWLNGKELEKSPPRDAAKMTAVRYFARDTGVKFASYAPDIVAAEEDAARGLHSGQFPLSIPTPMPGGNPVTADDSGQLEDDNAPVPPEEDDNASVPPEKDVGPGLAAWNDFSPVANAAKSALHDAAGIKVPQPSFIIWVVVGYLCVLVPANWLVFRLLGRVEWAWIAAPLIAIGCTALVVQQAQLNIGFARSRNEIAVVEMQAGYSRVHLTRYMVLYTSLATRYAFRLDDPSGQILPLPRGDSPGKVERKAWETDGELVCRRGDDTQLSGFSVKSNANDFMHSEEMADFGGTVTLHQDSDGKWRVTNGTKYPLDGCQAVRGTPNAVERVAVDLLAPGATVALKLENFASFERGKKIAADGGAPQNADPTGALSIAGVVDVALQRLELCPGEICLLAHIADEVPGLTVTPESQGSQVRHATLLVAHLDTGRLPEPERDRNTKQSVAVESNRDAEPANDE